MLFENVRERQILMKLDNSREGKSPAIILFVSLEWGDRICPVFILRSTSKAVQLEAVNPSTLFGVHIRWNRWWLNPYTVSVCNLVESKMLLLNMYISYTNHRTLDVCTMLEKISSGIIWKSILLRKYRIDICAH